jgi:FMN phosphatase YigB (HAD superfamily)
MPIASSAAVRMVCFDLGGVLVRICATWDDACDAAAVDVRKDLSSPEGEETRRALGARLEVGRISMAEWADGVSQASGGAWSPDEVRRIHDAITREEYAGALALIEELHDAGMATACLSNTNHAHWVRLAHHDGVRPLAGVPEYPSVVRLKNRFASHLLGVAKPDAAMYQRFERLVGLHGQDILFFDDRAENVDAARRLQWRAHRIDPQGDPIDQIRGHLNHYRVLPGERIDVHGIVPGRVLER